MSVYNGKLLELKSITNKSNKYFLKIRLSFTQDIDLLWEVDEYTAESLKTVTKFDGKYKYRLSFNNSWDEIHKTNVSILARTYRNQSSRVYFTCSQDYMDKLTIVKNIQHIKDIDSLAFLSRDLPTIVQQDKEEISQKKSKSYFSHIATVMGVVLLLMLAFNHIGRHYLNKTTFNEKVLAESIQLNNEVIGKQNEELGSYINASMETKDNHPNQPTNPFIVLDEIITYSIPKGNVALTFDDGPSKYSKEIADVLNEYGVGGTFFFTGLNVKKYPDKVQYIHSKGYSIGSHSINHINMSTLSYEKQETELVHSIMLLEEITNGEIVLFRPPYGSFNKQVTDLIHEHKYKMVLWNIDPKDWETLDADKIFNNIQNSDVSGSILLLHESQAVVDALPRIIEYLLGLDMQIINLQ